MYMYTELIMQLSIFPWTVPEGHSLCLSLSLFPQKERKLIKSSSNSEILKYKYTSVLSRGPTRGISTRAVFSEMKNDYTARLFPVNYKVLFIAKTSRIIMFLRVHKAFTTFP